MASRRPLKYDPVRRMTDLVLSHGRRRGCGTVGIAGEQGQERADAMPGLGGMAERPARVQGVASPAPGAGAGDVPGGFQVGHDRLDGPFGELAGRRCCR